MAFARQLRWTDLVDVDSVDTNLGRKIGVKLYKIDMSILGRQPLPFK